MITNNGQIKNKMNKNSYLGLESNMENIGCIYKGIYIWENGKVSVSDNKIKVVFDKIRECGNIESYKIKCELTSKNDIYINQSYKEKIDYLDGNKNIIKIHSELSKSSQVTHRIFYEDKFLGYYGTSMILICPNDIFGKTSLSFICGIDEDKWLKGNIKTEKERKQLKKLPIKILKI